MHYSPLTIRRFCESAIAIGAMILSAQPTGSATEPPVAAGEAKPLTSETAADRVPLAEVENRDSMTLSHVEALMYSNGIQLGIESNLAVYLSVPRKQAKDAVRILTRDASIRQYLIRIGDTRFPTPGHEQRPMVLPFFVPYQVALQTASVTDGLNVERLLRWPQVVQEVHEFRFVSHVDYTKRRYLSGDRSGFHEKTGYQVEVHLADGPQETDERVVDFAVEDGGKVIHSWPAHSP